MSSFESAIRSNNLAEVNQQLKIAGPTDQQLDQAIGSSKVSEPIRNLLIQYQILKRQPLTGTLNQDYADKGNINLFVISARGYLPLLEEKMNQLSPVINHQNNEGKTALHFALSNPNNINVVATLENNGANVQLKDKAGQTPFDVVKDLGGKYKMYNRLYLSWVDKIPTYFDVIPKDITGLVGEYVTEPKFILKQTGGEPAEIINLCAKLDQRFAKGCYNEDSDLWRQLYILQFGVDPDDSTFDQGRVHRELKKGPKFTIKEKYIMDYYLNSPDMRQDIIYHTPRELQDKLINRLYEVDPHNHFLLLRMVYKYPIFASIKSKIVNHILKYYVLVPLLELLYTAAHNGDRSIFDVALGKIKETGRIDYNIEIDIHNATSDAITGNQLEMLKYLFPKSSMNREVNRLLLDAIRIRTTDPQIVQFLIDNGADNYGEAIGLMPSHHDLIANESIEMMSISDAQKEKERRFYPRVYDLTDDEKKVYRILRKKQMAGTRFEHRFK